MLLHKFTCYNFNNIVRKQKRRNKKCKKSNKKAVEYKLIQLINTNNKTS